MEINKLRKVLTSFERNHGKLYESVDVEVKGEDITFNAKAVQELDGVKINVVSAEESSSSEIPDNSKSPHLEIHSAYPTGIASGYVG